MPGGNFGSGYGGGYGGGAMKGPGYGQRAAGPYGGMHQTAVHIHIVLFVSLALIYTHPMLEPASAVD